MKCQILFSGKNKKNIINLSSAENVQRVVKVNMQHDTTLLMKAHVCLRYILYSNDQKYIDIPDRTNFSVTFVCFGFFL